MIKRIMPCLLASTILSGAAIAQDETAAVNDRNLYVGGALLYSIFWDNDAAEFEIFGYGASGLAGLDLGQDLRVEGELLFETAEFDDFNIDAEIVRLTGSGYLDFSNTSLGRGFGAGLTPYAGAGAGIAFLEFGSDDDTELTFHGEVGATAPLSETVDFVPGVRLEYVTDDGDDGQMVTQLRGAFRFHL